MTAAVALQRFPQHAANITANEARWRPTQPTAERNKRPDTVGTSEHARKDSRNFVITCAAIAAVILIVVLVVILGNNKGEIQAERAASENCPSLSARANGECGSVKADEQAKHKEQVESEEHEAEAVIKKRAAESNASAAEGTR